MPRPAYDWTPADIPDLTGKTAFVTGTTGLCVAIVEGLARAGASVTMCGRTEARAQPVLDGIRSRVPGAELHFRQVDLADQASIRAFTAKTLAEVPRIDILILNAAVMAERGRSETKDRHEMMFGVNHLGHFALVAGLQRVLIASNARVVSLSSGAHHYGEFDFDDLMSRQRFKPMVAYGKTKLACLMFAKELDRRSKAAGWGITSVAAHPGFARTDGVFARLATIPVAGPIIGKTIVPLLSHPPDKAAWAILYAATSPDVVGGGNYGPVGFRELKGPVGPASTAYAEREDIADRLWHVSEDLTGQHLPSWRG